MVKSEPRESVLPGSKEHNFIDVAISAHSVPDFAVRDMIHMIACGLAGFTHHL